MILILTVMPVLVAAILCTFVIVQITLWKSKAEYSCSTIHLQNQDQIRIGYQALQKLNLGAQSLRFKKNFTIAKIAASLASQNYPAAARYKAKLNKIIARQKKYGKKQKNLELQVRNTIRLMNLKTNHRLKYKMGLNPILTTEAYKFTLVRSPASSLTPDYDLPQNFSKRQMVSSSWTIHLKKILPDWINFTNLDFNLYTSLKGSCSVTQYKKEGEWYAGLSKDKLSLSY